MNPITNVSRRGFLTGLMGKGAFPLAVRYVPEKLWAQPVPGTYRADSAILHPNIFLGIDSDGTVYIVAHRSEMGTTTRTSLPMVVADELDADWKRVKIEQAIGDERFGDQSTDGSYSVRSFFNVMRQAGATGRTMLIQAAAQQWEVPPSDCETGLHAVVHPPPTASQLRRTYPGCGCLPVPKKEDLKFKTKANGVHGKADQL